MKPLTPRERRLAAVGILVAAIAVVWLAIVGPIIAGFAERGDRREQLLFDYASNQRLIASIPQLRRTAERQRAVGNLHSISAPDAEQGAERLRERLEASVDAAGAQLRGSESIEAPPGWVRASVSAAMPEGKLVEWLARLSSTAPYLALEALTIGTAGSGPSSPSEQLRSEQLDVTVEASIPLAHTHAR